ncbi:MAG: stage III sporulation protein AE [Oscillospiraceae bacterium]
MKKITLLLFLALALCLSLPAHAAESLEDSLGVDTLTDALPESAEEALDGLTAADADFDSGLSRLWDYAASKLAEAVGQALRPAVLVVAIALVCSLAGSLKTAGGFDFVCFGGCAAVALTALRDVNSVTALGAATLTELSDFSKALLPTLTTAAAASGAVSSASAKYAAAALFLDVLLSAANGLLLPLIGAYAVCVAAGAAIGDSRLDGAAKLMKRLCKWGMTALAAAFTAYLGVSGLVASGADAAATKAAKAVLSAALPVVGKMVSDASESLVAGAGLLRNTVGVFGLLAVLAVCVTPFLQLGVRYLLFKAAAAVAESIAGSALGRLIDGIGSVYGMVLGLVGTAAVFLFISILSLIRTVV